jgi:RNA polymerase sigma factor (sigma-70 family)
VLALPDVVHFLADEFARLRRRRLARAPIPSRSFERGLLWHELQLLGVPDAPAVIRATGLHDPFRLRRLPLLRSHASLDAPTISARKFRLHKQVKHAATFDRMTAEQDDRIADVVKREQSRLRNFIRRRVRDARDVEDILQDVFSELVEANRLMMPIDHVTGWLFRVARNRITDLFRRRKTESVTESALAGDDEMLQLEELLPSPDAGPEALYVRNLLLEALQAAIRELPDEQRAVFVAHELEGRSFKEMAADTGTSINTLLSRKRYAVQHLRERLQKIYDELTTDMRDRR